MSEKESKNQSEPFGEVFFEWKIPEYSEHQRGFFWYLIMSALAIILVIYSILTVNFLFALIVILAVFIVFLKEYSPKQKIRFQIAEDGIIIGKEYIPYERIKKFYIIYKPPMVKKIFFDLKGLVTDIAIPLENKNPVVIRKKILEYLEEDLEKEHQSLSEQLDNILKL